jgi:hypothetical protein
MTLCVHWRRGAAQLPDHHRGREELDPWQKIIDAVFAACADPAGVTPMRHGATRLNAAGHHPHDSYAGTDDEQGTGQALDKNALR